MMRDYMAAKYLWRLSDGFHRYHARRLHDPQYPGFQPLGNYACLYEAVARFPAPRGVELPPELRERWYMTPHAEAGA